MNTGPLPSLALMPTNATTVLRGFWLQLPIYYTLHIQVMILKHFTLYSTLQKIEGI